MSVKPKSESLLALPRDERCGIDSKTAQDQSWRRETVRGAPPHQQLNRLPKTSLYPLILFHIRIA